MSVKRGLTLFLCVFILVFAGLNFTSAWFINGTVYGPSGETLNNTNISVSTIQMGSEMTIAFINSTTSNASGWFNLEVNNNITLMYSISLIHKNSTTNAVDFTGQSLPYFPYNALSSGISTNFYLKQAGTINITVINSTAAYTAGFAVQIKDTKLGYPLTCSGQVGNNYICNAPINRNYSIMIYPSQSGGEHFVPVSFSWTNFSSSASYNIINGLGFNISSYNGTTKTLHKTFNVTESFARITGYLQNSSGANLVCANFTVVPFLFEPSNMIFMTYGTLPWNISAWTSQSDIYNEASGFYNISLPYSSSETVNYLLYAAGQNGSFLGSYKNITVNSANAFLNFTMHELLGQNAIINMSGSTGGSYAVNTKRQTFNLVNATNKTLSNLNAHIETRVDYSSYGLAKFTFMEDLSSGNASFTLPLLNISGFKEMNIFTQTYSPKRVSTRTSAQIMANNNITMNAFNPQGINTTLTAASLNIYAYKSNSTCDVPNPPSTCVLTSFTQATAENNMFPLVIAGGAISLRMTYGSISVHYANVDLLASGPPEADFENNAGSNEATSGFQNAAKFGSQGPTIYDYVLVAMPYVEGSSSTTGLNESASVNMSIPLFYDEDYTTPIWNSSANGTNAVAFAGNHSHYSTYQSDWQVLMNESNTCFLTTTGNATINSSKPCHMQTTDNKIWIRLPHFSGTEPTATGSVITATVTTVTTTSSTSGSTADWYLSYYPLEADLVGEGYNKELLAKYRVRVKVGTEDHYVGVIGVTSTTATINVSSRTQQAIFNIGDEKKFEVTNDSYYDIYVKLNGITNNKANVTIKKINELIESVSNNANQTATDSSEDEQKESSGSWIWVLWVIVVVAVIVGVVFGIRYYNLNKHHHK